MIRVHLEDRFGKKWAGGPSCRVRGRMHHAGGLHRGPDLVALVSGQEFLLHWADSLKSATGEFALVVQEGPTLRAAVDRIRSMPLFYGRGGHDFYLSDDPYWIREQLGPAPVDACSALEFTTPGYVTGAETLYADIRQLRAGEWLEAHQGPDGPIVDVRRYYRFHHHDFRDADDVETRLRSHDEMLLRVFGRLIETLGGRPVLVPLSGGYDSRLIAIMLKRLGYANVTCFSYGVPDNAESRISKAVSKQLGFPWLFSEYGNEKWRSWYESDERRAYDRFADGLCNVSHVQDWPAVWQFKRQGLLGDDSVFIPGHSGDFLAGSHIARHLEFIRSGGLDQAVDAIQQAHYDSPQLSRRFPPSTWDLATRRVRRLIGEMPVASRSQALSACDSWDWQERQAKKIVNSVRAYEFWGYSWRIPLWDAEMVDWWEHESPLRSGTTFYDTYVLRQGEALGLPPKRSTPGARRLRALLKGTLARVGGLRRARAALNRREYDRHFLALYGIVPPERFHEVVDLPTPVVYYMAVNRLQEIQRLFPREAR